MAEELDATTDYPAGCPIAVRLLEEAAWSVRRDEMMGAVGPGDTGGRIDEHGVVNRDAKPAAQRAERVDGGGKGRLIGLRGARFEVEVAEVALNTHDDTTALRYCSRHARRR